MAEAKKETERIRKQRWRQNLNEHPAKYNKYLEKESLRKKYSNFMKSEVSSSIIIKEPKTRSIGYKSIRRSIKGNHKTSFTK